MHTASSASPEALDPATTAVPDSTAAAGPHAKRRSPNALRASIVDLTFGIWAIAVPTALAKRLINTDGDAARHLRMGEFILNGGLFKPDTFSHTKPGEAFLQTEWLSQVSYALAHRAGGLAGVCILAGLLIATTYALCVYFLRRRNVDPLLAYLTGIIAAIVGGAHWLARPHMFTLLGLSLLLFLLEPGTKRRLWPFAALFAVWSNFHPGFIIGLVLLGAYAVGEWLEAKTSPAEERGEWRARARYHALGAVVGLLASFANPQGPGFLVRIVSHLGDNFLLGVTNEFMSPSFHGLFGRTFLVVMLLVITALTLAPGRPSWPRLGITLLLLAAALHSQRNIPIFGLIALPVLALHFDKVWRGLHHRVLDHMRTVFDEGEQLAKPGLWAPGFAGIMLVLALTRGAVADVPVVPARFDPKVFPVAAVEKARAANLEGKIFNEFIWGGYMLYAWPEQKIFIDGMTDFFGSALSREYLDVVWLQVGWDKVLTKYGIDMVLIQPRSRVAYALRRDAGWSVWYEDETAVLFRKHEGAETTDIHRGERGGR